MLTFGNLFGFWALLAIPAIVAIHFLQRETRQVILSTLFLLDELAPESLEGSRFERLRNSVPLWLQILAVLLLTWILVQPRWLRQESVQHVVIVLDSSVSMLAFQDEMLKAMDRTTRELARSAGRTEWQLMESDTSGPTLYSGIDRDALNGALQRWKPHLGTHDFLPSLEIAQSLLRGSGTLLFVSDRRCELPAGVALLTVGHPVENCGFCGVNITGRDWQALVRNYGSGPQEREWWMEAGGKKTPAQKLHLQAGQSVRLSGKVPPEAQECELFLNSDAFELDDRLPFVVPAPKPLRIGLQANTPLAEFLSRFCASIENIETVPEKADLQLRVYDSSAPEKTGGNAIVFVTDPKPGEELLPGNVTAENHPLTNDLGWSGLLCRHSLRLPEEPGDQPLLWQGARPLIFLRQNRGGVALVVNFDLRGSNAARLPAFILLLHRFVEQVRSGTVAFEAKNFDTNQMLTVAGDPALPPPASDHAVKESLSAPATPDFFNVTQGQRLLLKGAAQFVDTREADFRDASSVDQVRDVAQSMVRKNSEADRFASISMLIMGGVMAASWFWKKW